MLRWMARGMPPGLETSDKDSNDTDDDDDDDVQAFWGVLIGGANPTMQGWGGRAVQTLTARIPGRIIHPHPFFMGQGVQRGPERRMWGFLFFRKKVWGRCLRLCWQWQRQRVKQGPPNTRHTSMRGCVQTSTHRLVSVKPTVTVQGDL